MAELCKYYKRQRYVSYNGGVTWQPLEEYERGELYESHSSSCGSGIFFYRWVPIENGYICDGKDRYTREVYQYSEDNLIWYNVFPTVYRKGTLIEEDSPFCDNAANGQYTSGDTEPITGDTNPCPPNYRWNGYECECIGHMIDGECIVCDITKHEIWSDIEQGCVCQDQYDRINGVCVYVDPLKVIKCEDSNGVLTNSDVSYYNNGWAAISFTIGDCITRIDNNAFNGQVFLTSVTIPTSVEEVGYLAFANCNSLESISFPSSLTELNAMVFLQCSKLKNVNFGGTIPSVISGGLFKHCVNLESASWIQYNNITSIGASAFFNCYSLENIVFPNTLTTIGDGAFGDCRSFSSITIPSGVTSIGQNAFKGCNGVTFININSDSVSISGGAFSDCTSLTSVTVNSSAVTMGNNVFSGCTSLLKMTFTSPTPFAITSGFFDNTNNCMLFVPCESLEAYKTAWSAYEDRISCTDSGVYYRWIDTDGTYCEGTDEYTKQKQQSTTNGITWTDTGAYRGNILITHYSPNCGYVGEMALTVTNEDGYTRYYEPCE